VTVPIVRNIPRLKPVFTALCNALGKLAIGGMGYLFVHVPYRWCLGKLTNGKGHAQKHSLFYLWWVYQGRYKGL